MDWCSKGLSLLLILVMIAVMFGCTGRSVVVAPQPSVVPQGKLAHAGYAIQVGAFSHLDNAVRLADKLEDRGLGAYYFLDETGLFKVRFGNFPSKERARDKAKRLYASNVIDDYYIVGPENYPTSKERPMAETSLRNEIVKTANRFLGLPYRWGGTSPQRGFDCSGLSMVVYRLNGLDLPRSSQEQWAAGSPVERRQLSKADLVFFRTDRRRKVSHVGIYLGRGRFIHAPGRGKTIRIDSLSNIYFRRRYVGAKTYL
jgi:hypothetical protein